MTNPTLPEKEAPRNMLDNVDSLGKALTRLEYLCTPGSTLKGYHERYGDIVARYNQTFVCISCGKSERVLNGFRGLCGDCWRSVQRRDG